MNAPKPLPEVASTRLRKLSNVINCPASAKQEVLNAQDAIFTICSKYGVDVKTALNSSERRSVVISSRIQRVSGVTGTQMELLRLLNICLKYVVNDDRPASYFQREEEDFVKGRRKLFKIWCIRAEVTPAEEMDWVECYQHHAPYFYDALKEIKDDLRKAQRVLKKSLGAYANVADLVPEFLKDPANYSVATEDDMIAKSKMVTKPWSKTKKLDA